MKRYVYTPHETELIKHLIYNVPHKIWWDYASYIFDYSANYIVIECQSRSADSQNEFDEAIIASITFEKKKYIPTEYAELVCENKRIEEAYIVRSFLYFTTHSRFTLFERLLHKARIKLKQLVTLKRDKVQNVIAKSVGVHSEISCHPNSDGAHKVDSRYANLIDKGLLLKIGDSYLPAYLIMNGYGFILKNNEHFFQLNELKEDFQWADFIKVSL